MTQKIWNVINIDLEKFKNIVTHPDLGHQKKNIDTPFLLENNPISAFS